MGHIRLGRLQRSKLWEEVIELLQLGRGASEIAASTARAAENELVSAKGDPGVVYTVWVLAQLPLAARSQQFAARLEELGFDRSTEQSLFGLVAGFARAVDRNVGESGSRTDLGELAGQAAAETLSSLVGNRLPTLFESTAEDVQQALSRFATRDRFAGLARDFFARLTQKTLEYYISRELPNHVGPGKPIASIDRQIEFRAALETHCREASLIVEQFAGGWFSKTNFQGKLTPTSAQAFADYALKKMRDELRARRARDG